MAGRAQRSIVAIIAATAAMVAMLMGAVGIGVVLTRNAPEIAPAIAPQAASSAAPPRDELDASEANIARTDEDATAPAEALRTLFGEVLDTTGAPIAGATVQARLADGTVETRASDDDGAFMLDGFRTGVVTLTFTAVGYQRAEVRGDMLPRMREASWSQKLTRSTERVLGIGGTVVDDRGAPVTTFRLVIMPASGNENERRRRTRVEHVSDEGGAFERTNVDAPVSLQVLAPTFRPAMVEAAPGDRVRIALVKSNALRGRITDGATGAPVVGAAVTLDGMRTIGSATTDAQGRYAIETLPVEKVSVNVRAEGYLPLTLGGVEGGRSRDETLDAKLTPAVAGVSTEVVGIGVSVGRHEDGVLVKGVFDTGPAHGVLDEGDVITEADGVSLGGRPLREGMAAIRGEPGTSVRLTLKKAAGGVERVTLERARVAIPEG